MFLFEAVEKALCQELTAQQLQEDDFVKVICHFMSIFAGIPSVQQLTRSKVKKNRLVNLRNAYPKIAYW